MDRDDWESEDYLRRINNLSLDDVAFTDYGTEVFSPTWEALHAYQREGCKWMYRLYQTGVGGILGDEMGLGKTAQLCAHFGSLARDRENRHAIFLVVCPATLLVHWLKELHRWAPSVRSVILHEISRTGSEVVKRTEKFVEASLKKLQSNENTRGLAVISTYEGLRKHRESLHHIEWTAVCLDEGQRLKNPSAIVTQVCKGLPCYHRIVLSGTPIQNSLKELWSIFDFIYPGRLGGLATFEIEFAAPIRAGGFSTASKLQVEIATQTATTLQRIVRPYILRRKKDDLQDIVRLPKKTEQILFCRLTKKQSDIYDAVLASSEVEAVLKRKLPAFRAITTLRKLCNHPDLVYQDNEIYWNKDEANHTNGNFATSSVKKKHRTTVQENEITNFDGDLFSLSGEAILNDDEFVLPNSADWSESGKLLVLSKILPLWHKQGHKVLLFSQTQSMLNLVESMILQQGFSYLRLDGSTSIGRRSSIVDSYNKDDSIFLMLLTTRTGGLGISLTAANRVLLIDPDWNPMTDIQARERSWRIGQQREVTIYRLISRGTIEEKIYQRQIFKILLSKRILENAKQKSIFSKTELKELFERSDDSQSNVSTRAGNDGGGVDMDLPQEGEIILRDNSAGNDEYFSSIREQRGLDDIDEDCVDGFDNTNENLELEDKEVVIAYRNQAAADKCEDGEIVEDDSFSIEEMTPQNNFPVSRLQKVNKKSTSRKRSATEINESSLAQDQKLLESLFSGDAITGVYDHNYVEDSFSHSSRRRTTLEEIAARTVQDALRRVEESSGHVEYSSANLLASIRERQGTNAESSSSSNSTRPNVLNESVKETIEKRLQEIFNRNSTGISSEALLSQFPDLGHHHAVLLKQLLKAIAVQERGVWKKKR